MSFSEENKSHTRSSSASYAGMQRDFTPTNANANAFAGARSPPKAKNTSHVPCKFYPFGTCQAGAACQFSHDLDPMTQNAPCKYFAKGSCKFGQGCALAHILPDGRVINRPPRGQPFAYARRGPPQPFAPGPPSLLSMQANDLASQQEFPYLAPPNDVSSPTYVQSSLDPNSNYGSPPNDSRLGASPNARGLSVLDAPLPSSFDSQGISHAARHGPFASSVPPRLGVESPPSSLPARSFLGGTPLRGLGDTANLDGVLHAAGSSPPVSDEPLSFSKRPLYSERYSRPRPVMSSSLGGISHSWAHFAQDTSESDPESEEEGIGEDLLPSSLHELLPQEKLRRPSRLADDDMNPSFLSVSGSAGRRASSNGNTPSDSKVGSPSPHSASPSRYTSIWSSQSYNKNDPMNNGSSGFGHVGSPLRPSSLRSSSLNPSSLGNGADFGAYAVGSPPRQASMSMLTQELQRTKITEHAKPTSSPMHPGTSRTLSNGSSSGRGGLIERGLSSNSLGRETIEEEQGLFSMEEEEEPENSPVRKINNNSNKVAVPIGLMPGKSEPTLGPIGGQRTPK